VWPRPTAKQRAAGVLGVSYGARAGRGRRDVLAGMPEGRRRAQNIGCRAGASAPCLCNELRSPRPYISLLSGAIARDRVLRFHAWPTSGCTLDV